MANREEQHGLIALDSKWSWFGQWPVQKPLLKQKL
jgi:hypothetical protein